MPRTKSMRAIRSEIIAQYKRQYTTLSTSSMQSLCKSKGFTKEDIEGKTHSQLAYMLAHAKYATERGYDIYGMDIKEGV